MAGWNVYEFRGATSATAIDYYDADEESDTKQLTPAPGPASIVISEVTAAPTAFSFRIQGSNDGVLFQDISGLSAVTALGAYGIHEPYTHIKVWLTSLNLAPATAIRVQMCWVYD